MLNQDQLTKLKGMGLSAGQMNQVIKKAGGLEPKKTALGLASNLVSSTANLVGSTAKAVLSPFDTVKNIISLAKDPQVVIDYYKNRYGKDLLETLYQDPAGVAADLSVLAGGVGSIAKLGGASKVAKVAGTVSKFSDPLQIAGMGANKVLKPIGSKISSIGENMAFSGLHDPKIQKNIKGITRKTPFELSQEYGTWSRKPEDVQKAISGIDEYVKSKLAGKNVNVRDIMKDLDGEISKLENNISDSAQIQKEYLRRKKTEIADSLVSNGAVDLQQPAETIVSLKRQVGDDVPKTQWNIGAAESSKGEAAKSAYNVFKGRINKLDKSLKQKGMDESGLIRLKELYQNEAARSGAKNTVSLGDMFASGIGFSAGGILPAVGAFATRRLLETPKAVEVASKAIRGLGNAKLPQSVKSVANTAYQTGKTIRTFTNPYKTTEKNPPIKQQGLQSEKQKQNKQEVSGSRKESSLNYTPQYTGSIKYKSPKLKSKVFGGRTLTKSSAY